MGIQMKYVYEGDYKNPFVILTVTMSFNRMFQIQNVEQAKNLHDISIERRTDQSSIKKTGVLSK